MDYQGAIKVLFTKLPMFQRTGPAAYKVNLDGTKAVCNMLGNPENDLTYIHIAGTNGKGTVAHMLSATLQTAGYKVGLFTSPHLIDFRERIRVNGEMIPEADVVCFVEEYENKWGYPSFFELTFGMAIKHFQASAVDIVILETGMGGRLDSTNVIPSADVCVVTNIGLDHQQFLGQTIRDIAAEKAGILKHGVPVVLGKMRPEAQSVILEKALKTSSEMNYGRVTPEGLNEDYSPFFKENTATAYETLKVLNSQGWDIPESIIIESFNNYREISGQRGRAEYLHATPEMGSLIIDCAHNIDGIKGFLEGLSSHEKHLHIVFGTVGDKDPTEILSLIPINSIMYWCAADISRAMPTKILQEFGENANLHGSTYSSVLEATIAARTATLNDDQAQAVICGSVFVVGEVI